MKSAIRLVVSLSVFAAALNAAGCSSSSDGGGPVIATAGNSPGASGGTGTTGGTGGSDLPPGIPITPTNGWVNGDSNTAMIQGALFSYADDTTKMTLTDTIAAGMNCMKGSAAKVDTACTPPAGMDCYGVTWGAAIGLNLNQPMDPVTMKGVVTPLPYDGTKSGITGFAFDISGATVPTAANFRFLINDMAANQYCSPPMKGIKKGLNVFKLSDLIEECWLATPKATDLKGDTATNNIVKIAWQVVTNSSAAVPFDFCIDSIEAITN